jgi:hypothetical protein
MPKPKGDHPVVRHMFSQRLAQKNEQPTKEEVERRAYQIYLSRGGQDGHAVEDWLQAEQELQKPL